MSEYEKIVEELDEKYHGLCGLTEGEVKEIIRYCLSRGKED